MKFLAALLCITFVAAEHASIWQPGKVFTYKHADQVTVGYPGAAPLTPTALTATVKLHSTNMHVHAKLEGVNVNTVTGRENVRTPRPHASEYAKYLETPFAVNFRAGVVKSLAVSPRLPVWAVNIIKAKVSVLNLNLAGVNLYDATPVLKTTAPNSANTFFRVYEETHYGVCEASYTISPLPAHLATCVESTTPCVEVPEEIRGNVAEHMVVTKAVDYQKCKAPATVAHIMPPVTNLKPYAPAINALYTRVTVTQYVLHGDRANFLVKSINHVEKVALNPLKGETEKVLLQTQTTWKLVGVAAGPTVTAEFPFTPKIVGSVVAEIVPLIKTALDTVTESPAKRLLPIHASTATVVGKVVAILTELSAEVEEYDAPEKKAISSKFLAVEEAVRFLDLPELVQVYEKIAAFGAGAKRVTMEAFFLDACVMCGNNPCVALIKKLVVEGKVSTERAAVIIMTLPLTIKTPTPAVLKELVALARAVKPVSEVVYANTLVAVSNVVFHHCVKPAYIKPAATMYAPAAGIAFCGVDTPAVVEFVHLCATEMAAAAPTVVKVAAVKALANTAHPVAVKLLKPVVVGAGAYAGAEAEFVRVAAVTALHRAAECHKDIVVELLMGVFGDLTEATAVRVGAASVVIGVYPTHAYLAKVALSTWYEPSAQVHAFVHTALKCLAAAGEPVNPVVNHAAKAAIAMCKPAPATLPFSLHAVYADYIAKFNVGAVGAATVIGSTTSFIPKLIQAVLIRHEGWTSKSVEAAVIAEGVEGLLRSAIGSKSIEEIKSLLSASSPRGRRSVPTSAQIHEQFKIFAEAEPVKAAAWVRIADIIEGCIAVGGENAAAVDTLIAEAMKAVDALRAGVAVNVQKTVPLVDAWVILPTECGYPVEVRIAMPVTISIRGHVKAAIGTPTTVEAVLKPVIAAEYQAKATVYGIPTETFAQAGAIARIQVGAPVSIAAKVNPVTHEAEFKVIPHAGARGVVVPVHVMVAPYVAYEPFAAIVTPVVHFPSFRPVKRAAIARQAFPCVYSKNVLGLAVEHEYETDAPVAVGPVITGFIFKYITAPLSLVNFPYYAAGAAVNYFKANVIVRPAASETKEFRAVVKYFANAPAEVDELRSVSAAKSVEVPSWSSAPRKIVPEVTRSTPICIRAEKPYRTSLEGARAHNVEAIIEAVGGAHRVYKNVISVVATPDYKLQHLKYVFACGAIPAIAPEPYKVVVEATAANHGEEVVCNVACHYGPARNTLKKISLKVKADKTEELRREEAMSDRKSLNRMALRIEHAAGYVPTVVHRVVRGVEHLLTYALYPYMAVEVPAARVPGRIEVVAKVCAKTNVCDIVVAKEAEKVVFAGVPVPKVLREVLPVPVTAKYVKKAINKLTGGAAAPICEVVGGAIVTFDGARIPVAKLPLNKEILLAKYIGSAQSAAVLLEVTAAGKVVKIVLGSAVIAVIPAAGAPYGVKVVVNGAAVPVVGAAPIPVRVAGAVIAEIVPVAGKGLTVVCPVHKIAVAVAANAAAVAVEATPAFRGKMTGVCGNYNGEKYDELETGKSIKVDEEDRFISKYYKTERFEPSKARKVSVEGKYGQPMDSKVEKLFSRFMKEE